jgi:hypothetical protein
LCNREYAITNWNNFLQPNKSLVFYFPYHGVGGVPVLFIRLAAVLKDTLQIYVADFSDGYMAKNLPDGVTLIDIEHSPVFPKDCVLVFQSFIPWCFPFVNNVDSNSKVLFWGLHPQNFDPKIFNEHHRNRLISSLSKCINTLSVWRRYKLVRVLKYLQSQNAVVFQGRENVEATEKYLKHTIESPLFLPIPVPSIDLTKKAPRFPKVLDCAWIGRICDFKYRILEHIIVRLARASLQIGKIRLLIIGNGEYHDQIEKCASLNSSDTFSVEFKGEIPMSDLPSFLVDHVDLLFAMGTSALEGARLGIPVFLANFSYTSIIRNYHFKLIFDNSGFCLGEEITETHYENESSLEDSLRAVQNDYLQYSKLSFDYWKENFSIGSVEKKFLMHAGTTTASFGEMAGLGFFKPDFVGSVLRYVSSLFRKDLAAEVVGFRHDC